MDMTLEHIEKFVQTMDITKAIIILGDKDAVRELRGQMEARDYPCGTRYFVITEAAYFCFGQHIIHGVNTVFVLGERDTVRIANTLEGCVCNIICLP